MTTDNNEGLSDRELLLDRLRCPDCRDEFDTMMQNDTNGETDQFLEWLNGEIKHRSEEIEKNLPPRGFEGENYDKGRSYMAVGTNRGLRIARDEYIKQSMGADTVHNDLSQLPLPIELQRLLSRWMRCPECGSDSSLEYWMCHDQRVDGSRVSNKENHRLRCHECNYWEERQSHK